MRISAPLPTGVAALLFESARRRRELENRLVEQLLTSGFAEMILPVVDYLDPYQEMLDAAHRSELYRFVDRDGELLALRSDFTPMLARLIAPSLVSLDLPLLLFYRGDVLRYQEERAGRQREFYQLGAEILGLPEAEGENRVLRQCLDLLAIGERQRLLVVVGFAGALDDQLLASDDPGGLAAAVVRRERSAANQVSPVLRQVVQNGIPDDPEALGRAAATRLRSLVELCEQLRRDYPEVEIRLDLAEFADQTLAPELDHQIGTRAYYDGLVFRVFAGRGAEPVGAGGRYDRLFRDLGGDVAACGFSLSLDRLTAREVAS